MFMIDCTFGCGGHTMSALEKFKNLHVVGLDIDRRMIDHFYESNP